MVGSIGINKRSVGRISVGWALVAIADNLACIEVPFQVARQPADWLHGLFFKIALLPAIRRGQTVCRQTGGGRL